ncbi:hypothetical protein FTUN_1481 [Frigoriglobus tundricola]|uniref:Uncharacterized protein n=1 Tax=Frigoriglobus tundricola TaxID=2774151 RepID=A0A6M5YK59_9BACT|nr:hypothetical protein FTUN_1481 [Frigoriglobus tundricola]
MCDVPPVPPALKIGWAGRVPSVFQNFAGVLKIRNLPVL